MLRALSIALGLVLVTLWVISLSQNATPWLSWLNGVVALLSFAMAALPLLGLLSRIAAPAALAIALGLMWAVGLATGATRWLAWWDLAVAFSYLGLAALGSMQTPLQRFRKPRLLS